MGTIRQRQGRGRADDNCRPSLELFDATGEAVERRPQRRQISGLRGFSQGLDRVAELDQGSAVLLDPMKSAEQVSADAGYLGRNAALSLLADRCKSSSNIWRRLDHRVNRSRQ